MTGQLDTTQKLPFQIAPVDANGNAREVEDFSAEVLDGADLTIEEGADGVSGFIVSGSTVGSFRVKFSADAQVGEGVVSIEETHDIIVTNPQATSLGGTFGPAVPK